MKRKGIFRSWKKLWSEIAIDGELEEEREGFVDQRERKVRYIEKDAAIIFTDSKCRYNYKVENSKEEGEIEIAYSVRTHLFLSGQIKTHHVTYH